MADVRNKKKLYRWVEKELQIDNLSGYPNDFFKNVNYLDLKSGNDTGQPIVINALNSVHCIAIHELSCFEESGEFILETYVFPRGANTNANWEQLKNNINNSLDNYDVKIFESEWCHSHAVYKVNLSLDYPKYLGGLYKNTGNPRDKTRQHISDRTTSQIIELEINHLSYQLDRRSESTDIIKEKLLRLKALTKQSFENRKKPSELRNDIDETDIKSRIKSILEIEPDSSGRIRDIRHRRTDEPFIDAVYTVIFDFEVCNNIKNRIEELLERVKNIQENEMAVNEQSIRPIVFNLEDAIKKVDRYLEAKGRISEISKRLHEDRLTKTFRDETYQVLDNARNTMNETALLNKRKLEASIHEFCSKVEKHDNIRELLDGFTILKDEISESYLSHREKKATEDSGFKKNLYDSLFACKSKLDDRIKRISEELKRQSEQTFSEIEQSIKKYDKVRQRLHQVTNFEGYIELLKSLDTKSLKEKLKQVDEAIKKTYCTRDVLQDLFDKKNKLYDFISSLNDRIQETKTDLESKAKENANKILADASDISKSNDFRSAFTKIKEQMDLLKLVFPINKDDRDKFFNVYNRHYQELFRRANEESERNRKIVEDKFVEIQSESTNIKEISNKLENADSKTGYYDLLKSIDWRSFFGLYYKSSQLIKDSYFVSETYKQIQSQLNDVDGKMKALKSAFDQLIERLQQRAADRLDRLFNELREIARNYDIKQANSVLFNKRKACFEVFPLTKSRSDSLDNDLKQIQTILSQREQKESDKNCKLILENIKNLLKFKELYKVMYDKIERAKVFQEYADALKLVNRDVIQKQKEQVWKQTREMFLLKADRDKIDAEMKKYLAEIESASNSVKELIEKLKKKAVNQIDSIIAQLYTITGNKDIKFALQAFKEKKSESFKVFPLDNAVKTEKFGKINELEAALAKRAKLESDRNVDAIKDMLKGVTKHLNYVEYWIKQLRSASNVEEYRNCMNNCSTQEASQTLRNADNEINSRYIEANGYTALKTLKNSYYKDINESKTLLNQQVEFLEDCAHSKGRSIVRDASYYSISNDFKSSLDKMNELRKDLNSLFPLRNSDRKSLYDDFNTYSNKLWSRYNEYKKSEFEKRKNDRNSRKRNGSLHKNVLGILVSSFFIYTFYGI